MSFHRGYGGKIVVTGSPNVDVCISKWTFTKKVELITVITSCGRTNLGSIPSIDGSFDLPWDDANTLETLGIDVDDTVTLRFYLGDSGDYYTGTVFIDSVTYTCDNTTGPVTVSVHFVANLAIGATGVTLTQP